VVDLIVQALERELPESAVWVGHLDRDQAVLRVVASGGETSFGLEPGAEAPLETSFCHVLASGVGAPLCNDVALDAAYGGLPAALALDVGSFAGAPLRLADGLAVGTLCAFHHERGAYSERELGLIGTFAALLARELEHERRRADLEGVVDELRRLASSDPLTGVANRRAFSAALHAAYLDRGGAHVALVDLDAFKQVNDEHGHLTGDRVLMDVAAALQQACRPGDTVGRLGGDEFGAVLRGPGVSRWTAEVKRAVAGAAAARGVRDGVSIGFAPLAGAQAPEEALAAADEALYEAKRAATIRG
jgi:diguanylate cyclase (GGDEF)-like protein